MKITATASGESAVTLADHGRESPSDFRPIPRRNIQLMEYVRETWATPEAGDNRQRGYQFSVTKQHATVHAAELYLLTLDDTVPEIATVLIELDDQTTQRWLASAAVDISSATYSGCSTTVTYKIIGGELLDEDPDEE